MKELATITLALLALGLLYLFYGKAEAQTLPFAEAYQHGKATGRLPEWLTFNDTFRLKFDLKAFRVFGCFEDSGTGRKQGGWTPAETWHEAGESGDWTFSDLTIPTQQVNDICWPPPKVPVSIGEPVYSYILHSGPTVLTPISWGVMDANAVVRQTVAGEPCEDFRLSSSTEHDDPKVGWYVMADGGVARCRAP